MHNPRKNVVFPFSEWDYKREKTELSEDSMMTHWLCQMFSIAVVCAGIGVVLFFFVRGEGREMSERPRCYIPYPETKC